jgi:hypothetical protein
MAMVKSALSKRNFYFFLSHRLWAATVFGQP